MNKPKADPLLETIDRINERLDSVEDLVAFMVRAEQRFKPGQRVKFSPMADRKGITKRIKGKVRRGKVVGTSGFSVSVILDGYKRPHSFLHSFFEPA
jgi:hypothetical protein